MPRILGFNTVNNAIVNADVNTAAAIAGSKIVAATASVAGVVTTGAQTFAGAKTFSSTGLIFAHWGLPTAPGYSFNNDPDTGIYSSGANQVAVTTSGTVRRTIRTDYETTTLPQRGQDGTAAAPSYTFSSDANTGMFRIGADNLGFSSGGIEVMSISSGGNVGISGRSTMDGTSAAGPNGDVLTDQTAVLRINQVANDSNNYGASSVLLLWNNTGLQTSPTNLIKGYRSDGSAITFKVNYNGQIFSLASTSITSLSDRKYKTNIIPLSGSLDKILQLSPSTWDWIDGDNDRETKGFIAQDVEQVYPEFVKTEYNGDKLLGMSGTPMIAELVKSIQEQQALIEALQARIEVLENK